MKKAYYRAIMIGAILLALAPALLAATTGQINYQARLLDAYGRRVNDTVSLAFRLYDAATAGTLLWSETHDGVVVSDGVYSITLGSTTPIPASVFTQDGVYLELAINNETMAPRQLITSAGQALVARTVMGEDIFVNQANGKVGIGTTTPAEKLDVAGTVKLTGFKLPTGATANYVLMSDSSGGGQWKPVTAGITETDPVFNAWSVSTYAPATTDLWSAVGKLNSATTALNTAVGSLQGATNTLQSQTTALQGATNALQGQVTTLRSDTTVLQGQTAALQGATNALNTRMGTAEAGIGTLNSATGSLQVAVTALDAATNALNQATNSMGSSKLDRVGGTAGNLTVTGMFVQAVAVSTQVVASGASIPVVDTFIPIVSTGGVVTASIGSGDTAGRVIILQGQSDANAVTLTNNPNLVILCDGVNFTLKNNNTMQLIWNNGKWTELNRVASVPYVD